MFKKEIKNIISLSMNKMKQNLLLLFHLNDAPAKFAN